MKISVFGGTGRTGQHLVHQALQQGHEVVVLARTPSKLSTLNKALKIIQGNVTDPTCVEQVITGADAVISALGPSSNHPVFEVSQGMHHILTAMSKYQVRRLVIIAGAGVADPDDKPTMIHKVVTRLLKTFAKNAYEDMFRSVALVRICDYDWTIVRAPRLTDKAATGQVKVGMVGKDMGLSISRADMANFILSELQSNAHLRKSPMISN
jgi:putative NADH-flavin reductase